jgi:hypothetical protein
LFNPEEKSSGSSRIELPKALDVQSAIKFGTATVALLPGEIDRSLNSKPSSADYVAVRLILFQSLDYSARNTVLQTLFMENEKFDCRDIGVLY